MTGYGEASSRSDTLQFTIELRAVNNRHLKVSLRTTEPYYLLEPEFERVIRKTVRRGTVQVHLRCREQSAQGYAINTLALASYVRQIRQACEGLDLSDSERGALLSQALTLPGVAPESTESVELQEVWPILEKGLEEALERLQQMRREEGQVMARELLNLREQLAGWLETIRQRIPLVTTNYRDRLHERVRLLLQEKDIKLDRSDLIKEVALFADRADITEEVVRLASHLDQFQTFIHEPESSGRKLEFVTQEMFREANTIGSKAGDIEISRCAVEIKAALERIRELVQNIE
jgi:uncharacterized protein (TIGR00255 family)